MDAREANAILSTLSPARREELLRIIKLQSDVNNFIDKPLRDESLLDYVTSRLSGSDPKPLRAPVVRHYNGKCVTVKAGTR